MMKTGPAAWLESIANLAIVIATVAIVWNYFQPSSASSAPSNNQDISSQRLSLSIDQRRTVGDAAATLALIEFSDFECPYCRRFVADVLPIIKTKYIDTGRMTLTFRHLPLERIHHNALRAAEAFECADAQDRAWPMHDALFASPTELNDPTLFASATALDINNDMFASCMNQSNRERINRDIADARRLAVEATPTFFLGTRQQDGSVRLVRRLVGSQAIEVFDDVVSRIERK
jgi:protein-disulfide isomerase